MTDRVALLRGINVGGHRVKMDRLRDLFEEMGFEDVETFIASGNVIFRTDVDDEDGLRSRIEGHLADALGYQVPTFVRSLDELEPVVGREPDLDERPGEDTSAWSLHVAFLHAEADADTRARFGALESDSDRFAHGERELYWSIRGRLSGSPLFRTGIDKPLGGAAHTMRNVTSLRRLVDKMRQRAERADG